MCWYYLFHLNKITNIYRLVSLRVLIANIMSFPKLVFLVIEIFLFKVQNKKKEWRSFMRQSFNVRLVTLSKITKNLL